MLAGEHPRACMGGSVSMAARVASCLSQLHKERIGIQDHLTQRVFIHIHISKSTVTPPLLQDHTEDIKA